MCPAGNTAWQSRAGWRHKFLLHVSECPGATCVCRSPRKHTNGCRLTQRLARAPRIPALSLCSFRGSSPTGTSDLTWLLCSSVAPLERHSVTKPLTKAMGFDVANQRIAEKDKIIPVSSKRSVPKEQLQLQVHRALLPHSHFDFH